MPAPPDPQHQPHPQDQPGHPSHDQRLTPTDVAQFLRLGECRRYLKMRLRERRKGGGFLRKYGVAPQAIPPLLTLSGQRFERHVEEAARDRFKVIRCGDDAGEDMDTAEAPRGEVPPARVDNDLVAGLARALPYGGTLLLFQPRLEAALGDWHFTGDLDILRLDRDAEGHLSALIVDMKSTTKAKLEHRLQVAFYHNMLVSVLGDAGVAFTRVDLGIVYRGSSRAGDDAVDGDKMTGEEMAQRTAAQALLGVPDALLEVIADPEDYLAEVEEMIVGPESVVSRVARTPFPDTPFHLSYKCDGCLYQEWCMKAAFEDDDLSLIPTLTASEKRALRAAGLPTTADVAGLMRIAAEPGRRPRLVPADGSEDLVRALRASPVGPRLPEIVHRAKSVSHSRRREIGRAGVRREEVNAAINSREGVRA